MAAIKEFNLSENMWYSNHTGARLTKIEDYFLLKDVKEFIRRLKEQIKIIENKPSCCWDIIDKLAGEKLT